MANKSFFKDEESFEKFTKMSKKEREEILNSCPGFYPTSVPEVDEILEEVKKKATEHKKKGVKK
jgi:hypothetical protein